MVTTGTHGRYTHVALEGTAGRLEHREDTRTQLPPRRASPYMYDLIHVVTRFRLSGHGVGGPAGLPGVWGQGRTVWRSRAWCWGRSCGERPWWADRRRGVRALARAVVRWEGL